MRKTSRPGNDRGSVLLWVIAGVVSFPSEVVLNRGVGSGVFYRMHM